MSGQKGHVYAMDLVRALTILSVIAVHSTWYTANGATSVPAGAALTLLHFTREAFMALTGFVLTYTYFGRDRISWPKFWQKRYRLIVIPYIVWSAAYLAISMPILPLSHYVGRLLPDLADGTAWFHLYYLLITMQFYLVMPLFLMLMAVAKKHPRWVVGIAVAVELALMAYDQYGLQGPVHNFLNQYRGDEVWTYEVYFVMGGVMAVHWQAARQWIARHLPHLGWGLAAASLSAVAIFFVQLAITHNLMFSESVLQPVMVPYSVLLVAFLVGVGLNYEARRQLPLWKGAHQLIQSLSNLSFGMYLMHPMLLVAWLWMYGQLGWHMAPLALDLTTIAVAAMASAGLSWAMSQSPFAVWLVGRDTKRSPSTPQSRWRPRLLAMRMR